MIIAGAGCFFLSNILTKTIFTPSVYGQYSILISYFSLIYVLGILGYEQVFLRFSFNTGKGIIETQRVQLVTVGVVTLISAVVSTAVFKRYYGEIPISTTLLFCSSLGMIATTFLFSVLRLNANFFLAQALANYWKIILLLEAVVFYVFKISNFELFFKVVQINIVVAFVLALSLIVKQLKFRFNQDLSWKALLLTWMHFFLAILAFSLITFADRFIIEHKLSFEEFGNYFYMSNFFLAPYGILQNYIGFKQLIHFKNTFDKTYYIAFNRRSLWFGLALGLTLFLAAMFLQESGALSFRFDRYTPIIFLLLLTGTLRLYSSSIVSAFEARTSISTLRKSNLYIVAVTVSILLMAVYVVDSIEMVLALVIVIWLFRCFVHRQLLLHQEKIN